MYNECVLTVICSGRTLLPCRVCSPNPRLSCSVFLLFDNRVYNYTPLMSGTVRDLNLSGTYFKLSLSAVMHEHRQASLPFLQNISVNR